MIAGAEQIAAAWQLYAVDHNNQHSLADWNQATGSSSLVPQYLSSFPILPKSAQNIYSSDPDRGGWSTWYANGLGYIARNYNSAPTDTSMAIGIWTYQLALDADWQKICAEAHKKLTGQTSVPAISNPSIAGGNMTPTTLFSTYGRAFCINDNGIYIFIYKVF